MSCCSKIADILKKVLSALGPILAIALVCLAAYFFIWAGPGFITAMEGYLSLPSFLVGLEPTTWGYIALGMAVVASPETITQVATSAGKFVGKVVSNVAGAILAGVAGGASGFFSGGLGQGILFAGLAYLGYKFFIAERKEESREPPKAERAADDGPELNYGV